MSISLLLLVFALGIIVGGLLYNLLDRADLFLQKLLDKLRVVHIELGEPEDDEQQVREIKPASTRKLKK